MVEETAVEPFRQYLFLHGNVLFEPGKSDVVEKALNVPLQDPSGGGRLPQRLEALVNGIRAPTLGPKPLGIAIRLGFGNRLERLQVGRLPCPIFHSRDRQAARSAVLLGDGEPFQGLRLVVAPLPDPGHRCGFLFRRLPTLPIDASCLLARVLDHPFDG